MTEEVKKEETKKKGPFAKLKEFSHDKEEQMEIFSTFVRLGILIWSGGILTLNYVAIPNFPQKNIDPTFIASVFTGVLASFGIQTEKKKNANAASGGGANIFSLSINANTRSISGRNISFISLPSTGPITLMRSSCL